LIGIVDYGMGNLGSVKKAFDFLNIKSFITNDKKELLKADKIVLPGVGAFEDAINNLYKYDLVDTLINQINNKKSFLGICLGFQLLYEYSEEGSNPKGFGVLKGNVKKFDNDMGEKVPHIGWNNIKVDSNMKYLGEFNEQYFYFVHSYYVNAQNKLNSALTEYGIEYISAIEKDNILACQFHPEKSGEIGLKLLKKWAED